MHYRFTQSEISSNRSMPSGVVIPELAYADVRQAVTWLCRTFGLTERLRIGDHRAQLSLGNGSIVVTRRKLESASDPSRAPNSHLTPAGQNSHAVMVRVKDIDSHYEHAKRSGAHILTTPADYPYGERQYTVEDLDGHLWTFSQTIADVDPSIWGGELFV